MRGGGKPEARVENEAQGEEPDARKKRGALDIYIYIYIYIKQQQQQKEQDAGALGVVKPAQLSLEDERGVWGVFVCVCRGWVGGYRGLGKGEGVRAGTRGGGSTAS
jgi:hypothetical protein